MFEAAVFQRRLRAWFKKNQRALPFRSQRDPYAVWLSEIMLQQTTMGAMLPYYERFRSQLPNIKAVAEADPEKLLRLWQGLGYYARVRNFQKACQIVLREYDGCLPQTYEELLKLPGIGAYTAAAIASICFDEPHAVLDGNVKRVLSRLFNFRQDISLAANKDHLQGLAQKILHSSHPGDHNQAMMELGALVCKPQPDCKLCPVAALCQARELNPELLPVTTKTKLYDVTWHALLITDQKYIILEAPHDHSLIRGMWQLPLDQSGGKTVSLESWPLISNNPDRKQELVSLGAVNHTITNRRITTHVYRHPFIAPDNLRFHKVGRRKLNSLAVNTLTKKILKAYL